MIRVWLATSLMLGDALVAGPAAAAGPLERCWAEVDTRVELQPCLDRLLEEAEAALETAVSAAEAAARELDDLTSSRAGNARKLAASQEAWRAYVDAECARRRAALEPGTGAGDVQLACRIELTEARAAALAGP